MKIGILTFHSVPNFGAFLQVYALSKMIESLGHEVKVIDLELPTERNFIGRIVHNINNSSFEKYRNKFLNLTNKVSGLRDVEKFDIYVVGSDQVWNKSLTKNNYLHYFFDFIDNHHKRISYAASFGKKDWMYSTEETETIKKLINKFSALSVREENAAELSKLHLNIYPEIVLDPTLLLKNYDELMSKKSFEEDYVTCFKFSRDKSFYDFVKKFKTQGFKIRELRGLSPFKGTQNIAFPSIGDWLNYLSKSRYILTDSFHGVCFSIIFKRDFIVIPADKSKFNRIENLLASLGLSERIFYSYDEILKDHRWEQNIDYKIVDEKLSFLRQKSISFLKNSLE